MAWRPLRPGETDHESIWLPISLLTLSAIWLWLHLGLPTPTCAFHEWTGWACPSCGLTRCLRALSQGHWLQAVAFNPLAVAGVLGVFAYDVYALYVLSGRRTRWRFECSTVVGLRWRIAVITTVALNWAWVLCHQL